MPRAVSSSMHGCIRSRSDSEPTRIPTSTSATDSLPLCRASGDIRAELHAVEPDLVDRGVRLLPGGADRLAGSDDTQDAAAVRHQLPVAPRRPGMEDLRAELLRRPRASDRHAALTRRRIAPARKRDADGRL